VAYGTLRFVPVSELRTTPLGPRDIVVTDEVPNDIPLIGGLVTEAFQTPLAHVNVLSRGRGTPNMALRAARDDARLVPYFGRVVKLEVTGSDFTLEDAVPEEALAFWESRLPEGVLTPRLDTTQRGVQPLEQRSLADLPSVGGKAAQMAELIKVPMCEERPALTPERPFAIPVVHSLEHYRASGAAALLEELRADPEFLADPLVKNAGLARVRGLVLARRVEPELLAEVKSAIRARWPGEPLRFRSSSNTEDLPGFSGAGLYTSEGVDAEDVSAEVEDAIRTVWASLWERRAYDEREYSGVDQTQVAMAVLVLPAYRSERVNGVAISRDALQPTRGDRYYVNAQVGEALVTNPAPGIDSEQFTYELYRLPRIVYHSKSTFSPEAPVIAEDEASRLACNLYRIHEHFRPLLDPEQENSWFAMDIEWKLMGEERALVIKQARAYSFGDETPTGWCDF
jgi:phosphoenolpyruvate synthase/pyruvate phosphate dikinase